MYVMGNIMRNCGKSSNPVVNQKVATLLLISLLVRYNKHRSSDKSIHTQLYVYLHLGSLYIAVVKRCFDIRKWHFWSGLLGDRKQCYCAGSDIKRGSKL